jgi:methyltransferase (TIGR00027 family)
MRTGLARTAIECAQARAKESARDDRLFEDGFAQAFLAADPGAGGSADDSTGDSAGDSADDGAADSAARGPNPALAAWQSVFDFNLAIRTRFFDDYLTASAAEGCRQTVILGAGLDSRAFRLAWAPGSRVFEVDSPDILVFKDAVLAARGAQPSAERVAVAADLTQDWQPSLTGAGFDPAVPTVWLLEGLLIYLDADQAAALLTTIGDLSAPGSRLTFEHANSGTASVSTEAVAIPELAALATMVKGGLGPDTPDWLAAHGWAPTLYDRAELAAGYGRPVTGRSNGDLVTARRAAG